MTEKEKALKLVALMDAKKARDITALDLADSSILADYFVIVTAGSSTQMRALSNEACEKMAEAGFAPTRIEGRNAAGWILIDFSGVILHIFDRETREFYDLEHLWADAARLDLSGICTQ